jgi:hypothetical protein
MLQCQHWKIFILAVQELKEEVNLIHGSSAGLHSYAQKLGCISCNQPFPWLDLQWVGKCDESGDRGNVLLA